MARIVLATLGYVIKHFSPLSSKKFTLLGATVLTVSLATSAHALTGGSPTPSAPPEPLTVELTVDGATRTVETTEATVGAVLEEHSLTVGARDVLTPAAATPVAEAPAISLVKSKRLRFKVGAQRPHARPMAVVTVGEALEERGLTLRHLDKVNRPLTAKAAPGKLIKVTRVKFVHKTTRERLKPKTSERKTSKLYRGERKVLKPGRPGLRKLTHRYKVVNGERVQKKLVKAVVERKPVKRVVLVGTKEKASLSGVWARLAQCESGGNPRIVSSNGLYHGLFQFSVGTWHSVGGSGLPSQASPGEQLKRAKILQARSGWGQWPACARALGLL